MPARFTLGIAAIVSVMISPYAYDYDLPIVGVGLALLLPDLPKVTSPRERSVMYGLIMLVGAYGLLQSTTLAAGFARALRAGSRRRRAHGSAGDAACARCGATRSRRPATGCACRCRTRLPGAPPGIAPGTNHGTLGRRRGFD